MAWTQYYAAASLDGFIARPDGDISWLTGFGGDSSMDPNDVTDRTFDEFMAGVGAVVMGSKTYEYVLEHSSAWPYDMPGWVLTSRDLPMAQGADLRMVNGDAAEVHGEAVEAAGEKNVWMVGGGNVASQWVEHGLIDELIVTLVPVILGEGLPLFASGILGEFRTKTVRPFASGMVELAYDFPR